MKSFAIIEVAKISFPSLLIVLSKLAPYFNKTFIDSIKHPLIE